MSFSYEQHEFMRGFLALLKTQAHLTAAQTQFMLLPYQAWLNSPFNPMAYFHGAKAGLKGFGSVARHNPDLADFTERLPDSVEITYAMTGNGREPEVTPSDKNNLKLTLSLNEPHKNWLALAEVFNMAAKEYPKPDFRIDRATIMGQDHIVRQSVLLDKPFAALRLFETGHAGPLLYIGAPISGHYSTLVRDTIQSALNAGFKVAVYDIRNARDVPASAGEFGLDDCVNYHKEFIEHLGRTIDPVVNVQAICQATVPVSRAAAALAKEGSPFTPFTLTLDAGPMNPRTSMTEVTEFAQKHDIGWFKSNLITKVPAWFDGARRAVYPGFRQLAAFISMNAGHHANSFYEMFNHLVNGNGKSADYKKKAEFYDEYLAVCDLPAKFYLDTIEQVFIGGNKADVSAYNGYLLTREAALDDIAAPGQTMAAHDMMPHAKGSHYRLEGAGHYGIFSGSKSRDKGLPAMFGFIHRALTENGHDRGPCLDSYGRAMETPEPVIPYSRALLESTVAAQKQVWADFVAKRATYDGDGPHASFTLPGLRAA